LVFVISAREMLAPWLISIAIDEYIVPGDLSGLVGLSLIMLGLYIVVALAGWLQQYLMIAVTQKTLQSLRKELFGHLQELDLSYFDSHPHGELMSRFTNDVENISNVLTQVIIQFLSSIVTLGGVLAMMLILNIPLALVTIVTVPVIFLFTKIIGKRTRESFKEQQKLLGNINGQMEETITGMKVVKFFCQEDASAAEMEKTNQKLRKASVRASILAGLMGPFMNLFNNLRYAVAAVAGGVFGVLGMASIGTIAAFLNYTRQFGRPLSQLAQLYNSILSALAGAERVFDVIDRKPLISSSPDALDFDDAEGHVSFSKVDFSYTEGVPVLKKVSFTADPGKTVALVGPTGAGKTTIVNLLTRFYDIHGGKISLDGRDITSYRVGSLRKNLGLVLQDTFLFSGTVMENLRYGNLEASDDDVYAAARASRADHFIRSLPEGYQTKLSDDGQNLSHGQRQLIAIARAVLANPKILILDEATSNVDTRTERHIQAGMMHLMEGRTSLVIAHRLSTIRDADMILVLKDGEIIERGSHQELLEQKGFYAQLHAVHFETEIVEHPTA
ncbi:MAG: ABC transporter ATP-binding protein/permease, partial [Spirochaetales bacterium]|nr:ABC transporter ATP-binding protein/permease [Spirochaetales bacterium]